MHQRDLPAGIAYGFHTFPESRTAPGKFYCGKLEGRSIAVIPKADWDNVPDRAELTTMWGQPKIKGTDHCDMKTLHGYLYLGYLLDSLEHFDANQPVRHCIRCGSVLITREYNTAISPLATVECHACLMWWREPYIADTAETLDQVDDDILTAYGMQAWFP